MLMQIIINLIQSNDCKIEGRLQEDKLVWEKYLSFQITVVIPTTVQLAPSGASIDLIVECDISVVFIALIKQNRVN